MRIKLIFLSALFALTFIAPGLPVGNKVMSQVPSIISSPSEDYIYVREQLPDGRVLVYVYLSDGITLVTIYEQED